MSKFKIVPTLALALLATGCNLTVTKNEGGNVYSESDTINCGTRCEINASSPQNKALTAKPDAGYYFVGWSGACTGTEPCLVQISSTSGNKSVIATFSKIGSIAEAIKASEANGSAPVLNRDDTVTGPDTDNNGVRDDIDTYINSLPDTDPQKAAMRQSSAALNAVMTVDTTSKAAVEAIKSKIPNAVSCLYERYDETTAHKKVLEMEKLMVNTKIRFQAYEKYNTALSGSTFSMPQGDGCEN